MSVPLQSSLFRRRDHAASGTPCVQQPQQSWQSSGAHDDDAVTGGAANYMTSSSSSLDEQQAPHMLRSRYNNNSGTRTSSALLGVMEQRERENEALMQALLLDVRRAKTSFVHLGEETRRHNALLDSLDRAFVGVRGSLAATMRSLDRIGLGSFAHMWLLFVFAFVFFVLMWATLKLRS